MLACGGSPGPTSGPVRTRLETSEMSSVVGCGETAECLPGRKCRVVLEVKAALLLLR